MSRQLRYIGRRLIYAAFTIFLLISVTFLLMHLLPGSPFSGNKLISPETEAVLKAKYGLDKPLLEQYGVYLSQIFKGDLGTSLVSGRRVTDIIAQAFPASLELGLRALIFALIMGLFLGIAAAFKHGTAWDSAIMLVALLGVSVPSFILGALLQYFLGLVLYQATGIRFFAITGWAGENSKLLPSFALAFGTVAIISRLMRSSMLEVLSQDYIRTARAKGLGGRDVVLHHCLKNAIVPVLIVLGPIAATLMTGTFAVENIFSIPGLGKYFVDSVRTNDYPVIVGTTLFFGVFLVICNLIVDIIHGVLDPGLLEGGGIDG